MAMSKHHRSIPELRKHDIISSQSTQYLVLSIIGEGTFGKVAKCINLKTAESTALKIHKHSHYSSREVTMLQKLEALDHEKAHLVRCTENFMYQDMSCLAFEMLDQSLWDLMKWEGSLSLNEIRPIAHQLLVTLRELKSVAIIHADLKPDNVMLVNHQYQPFEVKAIDFGLALSASETSIGMEIQALGYRAPEVMLGLPISAAIDMWAVGCILAFLYLGTHLFPLSSPYHIMRAIYQLLGKPRANMLYAGGYSQRFFTMEWQSTNPRWRMKTPEEYRDITGIEPIMPDWPFYGAGNLSEVVARFSSETGDVEVEDRLAFVDLLEQMLDPNADTRLKPKQALKHRFLTMDHLKKDTSSFYAESAFELMSVILQDDSDDSSSEADSLMQSVHSIDSVKYHVFESYQTGEFSQVIRCINTKTSAMTAIKVRKECENYITEVKMLQEIKALDPEKTNLVRFINNFKTQSMACVVLEMLHMSLWEFVLWRREPLTLDEIRPVAHQLLIALQALKSIGIIHTNLNAEHVMLVNCHEQHLRVKLIHFSSAITAAEAEDGVELKNCSYRPPEVILGAPLFAAIDMWGLGCVLAFLYFSTDLFPAKSLYRLMISICQRLGQPGDLLLNAGKNTLFYFSKRQGLTNPQWRLNTPDEYKDASGVEPNVYESYLNTPGCLEQAVQQYSHGGDTADFLHLLQQLLHPEPRRRMTATNGLRHDFFKMIHL